MHEKKMSLVFSLFELFPFVFIPLLWSKDNVATRVVSKELG